MPVTLQLPPAATGVYLCRLHLVYLGIAYLRYIYTVYGPVLRPGTPHGMVWIGVSGQGCGRSSKVKSISTSSRPCAREQPIPHKAGPIPQGRTGPSHTRGVEESHTRPGGPCAPSPRGVPPRAVPKMAQSWAPPLPCPVRSWFPRPPVGWVGWLWLGVIDLTVMRVVVFATEESYRSYRICRRFN